jgi:hypothetical protein
MQATVASYDVATRCGTVVTDAGRTLEFAAGSLAEHIRHLRPGQRVFLDGSETSIDSVRLW